MGVQMTFKGLDEFLREMKSLPQELTQEGLEIVREETEGAAQELRIAYGTGPTGNLQRRVRTDYPSSALLIGKVVSLAPHSHLWHFGTKKRQTHDGRNRGVMPAADPEPMVPIARRRRSRMARRLVELLQRKGFRIGNAA